jgi:hypothetical protein
LHNENPADALALRQFCCPNGGIDGGCQKAPKRVVAIEFRRMPANKHSKSYEIRFSSTESRADPIAVHQTGTVQKGQQCTKVLF